MTLNKNKDKILYRLPRYLGDALSSMIWKRRGRRRRRERRKVKEEESSQFIKVHKVDLGGESVASCSGEFGCCLRLCDCPFGRRFLARPFQHLVFVARCLFFELWFGSIPTIHHYSSHRLVFHGASVNLSPLHHHRHHHHRVPPG